MGAPQAPMAPGSGDVAGWGGQTALVICTAHGLQKVLLDADGAIIDSVPVEDGGYGGGHDCLCLAGCGLLAAALPESPAVRSAPGFAAHAAPPARQPAAPPPVRGPPLGSRAPPSRLG